MRQRTIPAALAACAALALATAPPARSRPVRVTVVDSDAATADAVVVGTVTGIRVVGTAASRHQVLDHLQLTVRVDVPIKGPRQALTIFHERLNPRSTPMINAYSPIALHAQRTYLFFLKAEGAGQYRLVATEDPYLVPIPAADLPALRRLPRTGTARDRALAVLRTVLSRCRASCWGAVWLLEGSAAYRRQTASGAARRNLVADLVALTRRTTDANTLGAAYTFLGRLGATQVLGRIVQTVVRSARPGNRYSALNVLGWLQGFSPRDRIRALRQILNRPTNPEVRRYALDLLRDAQRQAAAARRRP